jgi:hypothetical protein
VGDFIEDVSSGEAELSYPLTLHPETMDAIVLAGAIATPAMDEDDHVVESRAVRLNYFLDAGSKKMKMRYLMRYLCAHFVNKSNWSTRQLCKNW